MINATMVLTVEGAARFGMAKMLFGWERTVVRRGSLFYTAFLSFAHPVRLCTLTSILSNSRFTVEATSKFRSRSVTLLDPVSSRLDCREATAKEVS